MEHLVDGKFSVRLDETTFEHQIGKVVLEVDTNEEKETEQAQAELDAFLKKYEWFFGNGAEAKVKAKDKVRAFLQDPKYMLEDPEFKEWWMGTKWNTRFVDDDDVDVD